MKTKTSLITAMVGLAAVLAVAGTSAAWGDNSDKHTASSLETPDSTPSADSDADSMADAAIAEAAHAIDDALEASGWDGYSSTSIDRNRVIVHAVRELPAQLMAQVERIAGNILVATSTSRFKMTDYEDRVDQLTLRLGRDGKLIDFMAPSNDERFIEVVLVDSPRTDELEARIRSDFAGFPLQISRISEAERPARLEFGSRWADTNPLKGGIQVSNSYTAGCTLGFSARRNSDNAKVMLTAWHCNGWEKRVRGWFQDKQVAVSSATEGYPPENANNLVDGMYIFQTGTSSFGSRIYVGTYNSTNTKLRKGGKNPLLGEALTSGGAYSGGSTNEVTKIGVLEEGIGRGFYLRSESGKRVVGEGDSGGPIHKAHSDGSYSARGIVQGQGRYVNGAGNWVLSPVGSCQQGIADQPRLCSVDTFNMNIETLETLLKVTVYSS